MFTPLIPVSRGAKVVLGIAFFVVLVGLWSAATYGEWVTPLFLKDPWQTLLAGYDLFATPIFQIDIGLTVWRVVGGFVVAAAIGVPLGILMGAYKPIEAFFEP
ncbi:MAG: ABC transporter permease, partial [Bauldia sp.]